MERESESDNCNNIYDIMCMYDFMYIIYVCNILNSKHFAIFQGK